MNTISQELFTIEDKDKMAEMLLKRYEISGFGSQAKFATSIGLDKADITNIKGRRFHSNPQLVGIQKWIRVARIVGFTKNEKEKWVTAETQVFKFITKQLRICKDLALTNILVDEAGIGKTHTCKHFAANNPHVFYIDCSNARTKNRFILAVATAVGVDVHGRYDDILADTIYTLQVMPQPLCIFDEAGDLDDKALLEFKRMYNALEDICGFYLLGSDGLKARITRGIRYQKVGFKEVFSRFGKNFSFIMSKQLHDQVSEFREMGKEVLEANGINNKEQQKKILGKMSNDGIKDLRTIRREVRKLRYAEKRGVS